MTSRRPSAALTLGLTSGLLAAATFLPTLFPVTRLIWQAERQVALREVKSASEAVLTYVHRGVAINEVTLGGIRYDLVHVTDNNGATIYQVGEAVPLAVHDVPCERPGEPVALEESAQLWVAACESTSRHRVLVARQERRQTPSSILVIIGLLALFVGLMTALGVVRLLSPLTEVGEALMRVGAGQRGVRLPPSGFAELDELVSRLNEAAASMENREDAILARIQVVQEMARLVAHEVRNPLQSLDFLAALMAGEESPAERRALREAVRNEIQALDAVVRRMLRDGAGTGALQLKVQPTPLAKVISPILQVVRPAQSRVTLRAGPLPLEEVQLDPTLIGRCLENLVRNALEALGPAGGRVFVAAELEPPWVYLRVDDDGPGVDPELVPSLFEAAVTNKQGGNGLGLSLVKGVVEAHGGQASYERSPLGGARFTLKLPIEGPGSISHVKLETTNPGSR